MRKKESNIRVSVFKEEIGLAVIISPAAGFSIIIRVSKRCIEFETSLVGILLS